MGLVIDVRTLLSTYELMVIFGVRTVTTMSSIIIRSDDFPAPVLRTGTNDKYSLYAWPDVLEWSRITGRLTPGEDHWPQTPPPPQLYDVDLIVGTSEITERLGYATPISFATVRNRSLKREGPDRFPDPIHRFGQHQRFMLWYWPAVLTWAYSTGRISPSLPPPPPTGA